MARCLGIRSSVTLLCLVSPNNSVLSSPFHLLLHFPAFSSLFGSHKDQTFIISGCFQSYTNIQRLNSPHKDHSFISSDFFHSYTNTHSLKTWLQSTERYNDLLPLFIVLSLKFHNFLTNNPFIPVLLYLSKVKSIHTTVKLHTLFMLVVFTSIIRNA